MGWPTEANITQSYVNLSPVYNNKCIYRLTLILLELAKYTSITPQDFIRRVEFEVCIKKVGNGVVEKLNAKVSCFLWRWNYHQRGNLVQCCVSSMFFGPQDVTHGYKIKVFQTDSPRRRTNGL